jgi:hypothetical protein
MEGRNALARRRPSAGKLQMRKSKGSKTHRAFIFDKRFYAVASAIVVIACGLFYFRGNLPMLNLASANSQQTPRELPNGSILIPYGDGLCRLHAIDTKTGRIRDDGLVDCVDAADQTTAAWKSFVEQQRANEIRKSFRNE